jgi:hypothetical protein
MTPVVRKVALRRLRAGNRSPGICGLGHSVAVHLGADLLRRHALLVAKTRKGKSGLLRRLWHQLVTLETPYPPAVVLVDPHCDLTQQALGLVPADRQTDVVYLDVGRALSRPFGLNLLDVGLGWSRDQLVENGLRVFKHEFDNLPLARSRPSGLNATSRTPLVWPRSVISSRSPFGGVAGECPKSALCSVEYSPSGKAKRVSHRRTVPSSLPLTSSRPSVLNATP